MHDKKIQKTTAAIAAAILFFVAAPLTASLQAASVIEVVPIAQMSTDAPVVYEEDDGFPWGLLGLLGLIGLAGLKGKDNDSRVRHDTTTGVRSRPDTSSTTSTTTGISGATGTKRPEDPGLRGSTAGDNPNRPRT